MSEGDQDHGPVAVAVAVLAGRFPQPLDLVFGQVLALAIFAVRLAPRRGNCP
jgi:hypothetical protein